MILWGQSSRRSSPFTLARGETDWQGNFAFDDVRAIEEAYIEVQALYYLSFQGQSFSIPPGEELEIAPVTLHFGGSIHGEVRDGERREYSHADVRLTPRVPGGQGTVNPGRTDSKGTLLLSGIEPGEYTVDVLSNDVVLASIGSLWVRADAPTVKIHVRLDELSLTFPRDQDPQQFRVYRTEKIVSIGATRFVSLAEIQGYVDGMIASGWWKSEFPEIRAIEVRAGQEEDPARGGVDSVPQPTETAWESWGSGHIELPPWAWRELVVLHEVAHVVSPGSEHGQLFARNFHYLVKRMLGEAAAAELSMAYGVEGVAW